MKRPTIFFWLMLPPALLLCAVSLGVVWLVLSMAPPAVAGIASGVLVLVVCWLVFVRRRGSTVTGSETSLLGRQSSKEGLL